MFIGILGFLGVVVPLIRDKMGKREKALWVALFAALLYFELRSIDLDQVQAHREQSFAQCENQRRFEVAVREFDTSTATSQQQFAATMQGVGNVLQKTDQAIDATLGGTDSFCFIEPSMDHSIGAGKAGIFHDSFVSMKRGRSPLRNIHLTVITTWHFPDGTPVTSGTEPYSFGDAPLGPSGFCGDAPMISLLKFPPNSLVKFDLDKIDMAAEFSAMSGRWYQAIHYRLVKDRWEGGSVVRIETSKGLGREIYRDTAKYLPDGSMTWVEEKKPKQR